MGRLQVEISTSTPSVTTHWQPKQDAPVNSLDILSTVQRKEKEYDRRTRA